MPQTQTPPVTDFHLSRSGQRLTAQHDTEIGGVKVRLTAVYDSVAAQSSAYAEGFSRTDVRWNRLQTLPHDQLSGVRAGVSGYQVPHGAQQRAIGQDLAALLEGARRLLA